VVEDEELHQRERVGALDLVPDGELAKPGSVESSYGKPGQGRRFLPPACSKRLSVLDGRRWARRPAWSVAGVRSGRY